VPHEKILILESTWATKSDNYVSDSRSTARIYLSFESFLSLHDVPVFAIHRPLLSFDEGTYRSLADSLGLEVRWAD
jgi:hypothetical protein